MCALVGRTLSYVCSGVFVSRFRFECALWPGVYYLCVTNLLNLDLDGLGL